LRGRRIWTGNNHAEPLRRVGFRKIVEKRRPRLRSLERVRMGEMVRFLLLKGGI
jgi:hypothetical protein